MSLVFSNMSEKLKELHFEIPYVYYYGDSNLELGKMCKNWDDFLAKYHKIESDLGLVYNLGYDWKLASFKDFVKELKEHNNYLIENNLECALYNMELLDELIELAIKNRYLVKFVKY